MSLLNRMPHAPVTSVAAAWRTAVFVIKVLPMIPSRPLDWVTPDPVVRRVRYPTPTGETEGDLYAPPGPGPHPGLVVCLGVVPFEVDHPQVPRLGAALARAGYAALLYRSPAMRDLRLDVADIDGIALAWDWLARQPTIDPARSGLLGTCVGSSFALMAAARPLIRDRIALVATWAPYGSLRTFARDIASASMEIDGRIVPWEVDQLTRKVFVRTFTEPLPPDERDRLRALCAERAIHPVPPGLSSEGHATFPLLTALDREAAGDALDALPASILEQMRAISPETTLDEILAPLITVYHDAGDTVIPISQSRDLISRWGNRPGLRYTVFRMFRHVDPTKVSLSLPARIREFARFFVALYPLFRQSVAPP